MAKLLAGKTEKEFNLNEIYNNWKEWFKNKQISIIGMNFKENIQKL